MFELVIIATVALCFVVLLGPVFCVLAYRRGYRRGVDDGQRIVMVCAGCPNEDRWLD